MPVHHNDLLDDPLMFDHQRSFIGGQVSFPRVNLLSEDQGAVLQNVDLDTDLVIGNRRGFRKWGDLSALVSTDDPQGLWWFDSGATQFVLALAGGKLYKAGSNNTWAQVSATATGSATLPGWAAQSVDTFYLGTGADRPKFWSGSSLTSAGAGTAVSDGPSKLSKLCALRYRLFGLNADSVDEIYCSRFLPNDGTPFTFGGSPIQPFRVGEGSGDPVTCMVPWKGLFSLIVVRASSIWAVDTTPAPANTTAATMTSTFGIQQVGWLGSVAARSVVRSSNDILFLAEDGVRSLARTVEDGDGKVSDPVSWPITDLVDRINRAAMSTACAVFHDGRYILGVPIDNATSPNVLLVLNVKTGAWVVWTGVQPVAMVVSNFTSETKKLLVLDARGHVLEYRDHVQSPVSTDYRDNVTGADTRVPWRVRTRGMTFGDPAGPKSLSRVEFEFDRSEAIIDVDVHLDNDVSGRRLVSKLRTGFPGWILAPEGATSGTHPGSSLDCKLGELKVKRVPKSLTHYGDTREVMFEVREAENLTTSELSETGTLRMRSIQAASFPETLEKEE